MRNVQTWVVVIAALALGGGMFAFLVSTPDMGRRVPTSELGFRELERGRVDRGTAFAANHHRQSALLDAAGGSATKAAQGWIGALAQSRGRAVAPVAARSLVVAKGGALTPGIRRATAFVTWGDDLPRSTWRARMTTAEDASEDPEPDAASRVLRFEVAGTVTVTVAQAASTSRVQKVPVTLMVEAPMRADAMTAPTRWTLVDVEVGGAKEFVRAYRDPIIVRGSKLDVVAPATAAPDAAALLPDLERRLAAVRARAGSIEGATTATVWLIERRDRTKAVVGGAAPAPAWSADPHEIAWVDARGELVVDLAAHTSASPPVRAASLRHAAAHLGLRSLETFAPTLLVEGIAQHVTASIDGAAAGAGRMDPELVVSFRRGASGIAKLLVAAPRESLSDGAGPDLARMRHEAARLTVEWIVAVRGQRALVSLLASLERGDAPAGAVERVLDLAPRDMERAVGRWARARDAAAQRDARAATTDPQDIDPAPAG